MNRLTLGSTIGFVLLAVLSAVVVPLVAGSRQAVVLSRDQPHEVLYAAMIERGIKIYAAYNRQFPSSLEQVETTGLTAYRLPAGNSAFLHTAGNAARVNYQQSLVNLGQAVSGHPGYTMLSMPPVEPVVYKRMWHGNPNDPDGPAIQSDAQVEQFVGGKRLAAGNSPDRVIASLRLSNIFTHICWASQAFGHYRGNQMPASLGDLELFTGDIRNPAAWDGVFEVTQLRDVERSTGALFVGLTIDHEDYQGVEVFVVSMNNGISTEECVFSRDRQNRWVTQLPTY